MSIFTSVALGWLARRLGDWGGWIATGVGVVMAIYGNLSPADQQAVMQAAQQIVTGKWRDIPLGQVVSLIGIVSLIWSQRASFRATTRPQIVTPQGEKVELDRLPPAAQADVTITAKQAPKRRTLADLLAEKLGRR